MKYKLSFFKRGSNYPDTGEERLEDTFPPFSSFLNQPIVAAFFFAGYNPCHALVAQQDRAIAS